MRFWLLLAGALTIATIIRFWRLGAQQPSEPLNSRETLRASLELLWRRGVDGTQFLIEFPGAGWRISVAKRVADSEKIELGIEVSSINQESDSGSIKKPPLAHAMPWHSESADRAHAVHDAMRRIEEAADSLGMRLFQEATARFSGPVLAFNFRARTASPD